MRCPVAAVMAAIGLFQLRAQEDGIDPGPMAEQADRLKLGGVQVDFHDGEQGQQRHDGEDEQGMGCLPAALSGRDEAPDFAAQGKALRQRL